MKNKLTLLIALSILAITVILCFPTRVTSVSNTVEETSTVPTTTTTTTTVVEEPKEPETIAEQIWNAMKNKGWSDDVCAGIMGNIMAECGGGTLDIHPYAHGDGKTSYGICQWHKGRKKNMLSFNGNNYNTTNNLPPIEHQVDYIEYELEVYDIDILSGGKDYKEIAYIFCVRFEIPYNKYKKAEQRKAFAEIAYKEFAM